jgi:hypothetical protein
MEFKINIFGYSIKINKQFKPKLPHITESYITFDDYVYKYNCSSYETPTNYNKVKTFDGNLIDFKEGIVNYNEIIVKISLDEKLRDRIKIKNTNYHQSKL